MSSISLGVAALVAIDSFAGNVTRSVREQSRALLGGDLSFSSRAAFSPAADSIIDSLGRAGVPAARLTTFASMAVVSRTAGTRLVQVRAVTARYPFYGTITTRPAGQYPRLQQGANALVDVSVLSSLDARVGDSLSLGYGRFEIIGTLENVPGDPGVAAALGPRVFIPARFIPETQLLGLGSRAEYEALFRLPPGVVPAKFVAPLRPRLERSRVNIRTIGQTELQLTEATNRLRDFLGIVGLIALLLGGIGVASGVHAFVLRKIDTAAVLRCLGATSGQVLAIYLVQAAAMGLLGAAAGVALGVGIQFTLPRVIGDFLPVDIVPSIELEAVLSGLGVGLWVALAFALRPLLALRVVSPLQALRRDTGDGPRTRFWRDRPRLLVNLGLVLSVLLIALSRAQKPVQGVAITAGIGVALLVLWLGAASLSWLARRLTRPRWPYVLRQGVANLYRPANQTRAVVLSLGFGAFLISTIFLVQTNLLRQFDIAANTSPGNVLFFDVQEDQAPGIDALAAASGLTIAQRAPIVSMRIASINGRTPAQIVTDRNGDIALWPLRREYRSTYRARAVDSERITAGRWFRAAGHADTLAEVSMEQEIAKEMHLSLGDLIEWNIQGVKVRTRVTSFREVSWARFEPNFFAVFSPGSLDQAPKQFVMLVAAPPGPAVSRLQRSVVDRFPNVASIDLSLIQQTVAGILRKVSLAVRFMAVFCVAMGIPVLFSAVSATRRDRLREGVLLKTLGATRAQVARILLSEYTLLGVLGGLTGVLLSAIAAWALTRFVFENEFAMAWGPAGLIALAMVLLTVTIGMLTGRDVFAETPMAALREA